jgi:hypothetical protein
MTTRRGLVAGAAVAMCILLLLAVVEQVRSLRYALVAGAITVAIIALVWLIPIVQSSLWPASLAEDKRIELTDKVRGTVVQLIGAVGLVATAAITVYQVSAGQEASERTLRLTENAQAAERFGRAIEQLGAVDGEGNAVREIRIGGLYALQEYAFRSASDRRLVGTIVAAYIRTNSDKRAIPSKDLPSIAPCRPLTRQIPVDVSTGINVLRELFPTPVPQTGAPDPPSFDLEGSNLVGADLHGLDLRGANLSGAQLSFADLDGANLSRAQLGELEARYACFAFGQARDAQFTVSGQATAADLREAAPDLKGATFIGFDLTDAALPRADLRDATLNGVTVEGTDFAGADFRGATFRDLTGRGNFSCGGPHDFSCDRIAAHQTAPR